MTWLSRLKKHFLQSCSSLIQDLRLLKEVPIPASELNQTFLEASLPSLNFYLLLALASTIATFGLLSNSAATIIGAMIIAPLMNPIVSLAYALVVLNPRLLERAIFTLITGVILVFIISYFITDLVGLKVVGSEILARTEPHSLDLGVAVASGVAAAFANSRRSIANALPGVAIAVALVPPLAVVGIGWRLGDLGIILAASRGVETSIPEGSFLLFITNLAGIVFGGSLVFSLARYGNLKKASIGLIVSLLSLFMLLEPLNFSMRQLYFRSVAINAMLKLRQNRTDIFTDTTRILSLNPRFGEDGLLYLDMQIETPVEESDNIQEKIDIIAQEMTKIMKQPVTVNVDVNYFEQFESQP